MRDQVTQSMALAAMARDSFPLLPTLGVEAGVARPSRHGVRRAVRVVAAVCRLAARRMPRWALPVMAVMAVIPLDPFDELPLLPVVLYVAIRYRAEFAAVAREAWSR